MADDAGAVVAIIPARGGSKGVPGKNVRPLGGHPLIAWSIAAAKQCPKIHRVVVSTDALDIAKIARHYGAEAPFMRPAELAGDRSPDRDFVLHALDWFRDNEGGEPAHLVHLRPTTPLRAADKLAEAIDLMISNPDATALRSAHALAEPPHKMFQVQGGYLTGFFPADPRPEYYNLPRQMFPTVYQPNGYVDILRTSFVRSGTSLHGTRMLAYVTPFAVEVDLLEDIARLEYALKTTPSSLQTTLDRLA